MTVGPFDEPVVLAPTEYGGKAGWMQSAEDGHEPTPSERLSMVNRTDPADADAIDPVTELPQPME